MRKSMEIEVAMEGDPHPVSGRGSLPIELAVEGGEGFLEGKIYSAKEKGWARKLCANIVKGGGEESEPESDFGPLQKEEVDGMKYLVIPKEGIVVVSHLKHKSGASGGEPVEELETSFHSLLSNSGIKKDKPRQRRNQEKLCNSSLLMSRRMKESDSVMDHVNKMLIMAKDLAVVENVISDNMHISTILNNLPPSWDVAVTALSLQFDNLTLEKLPIQLVL
ncbi:hypothetical protein EJ110_NYTH31498 [Nymphaea thermarum]|nr:hypothetical protein EJ110_NYTH31498 [Nymphaea thermarum]